MGKFLRSSKKKRQTHEASRESAGSSADPATDRSHDARAHTRSKSSRRPMGRRELSHAAEEDPELADETPDQAWTRGEVQSKFEVSLTRDEKTNSLGMQLDEFQGEVTVVWVVPGGAADKSGTVQMGDEVVGVDGVESHGLNELKGLVIQAKSTTLLFTIQRRVATTVHSGTVMMLRGGGGSTYDPFELILDSNRVLSFKGKGQEQTRGVIDIVDCLGVRLVQRENVLVVTVTCKERAYIFYAAGADERSSTGTNPRGTMYWEDLCSTAAGFLSPPAPAIQGWMRMLHRSSSSGRRRFFELSGAPATLLAFQDKKDDERDKLGGRTAVGMMELSDLNVTRLTQEQLKTFAEHYAPSGGLTDAVVLHIDVPLDGSKAALGLSVDGRECVESGATGSAAEASLHSKKGLHVGDRIIAVNKSYTRDGDELWAELKKVEKKLAAGFKGKCSFVVERKCDCSLDSASGGLMVEDNLGQKWVLQPCAESQKAMSHSEVKKQVDKWLHQLRDAIDEAKSVVLSENILLQQWMDVEVEGEWEPHFCVFSFPSGFQAFIDEAVAKDAMDAMAVGDKGPSPAIRVPLNFIVGGKSAEGLDYYEGVISIVHPEGEDFEVKVKFGALGIKSSNFLSALNIYGKGQPASTVTPR
uniref:PDZ domain-containing protein n=1 Tax=Haptolina ericina TaxID=156174 RepID=A0A7S3BY05_9EUKA